MTRFEWEKNIYAIDLNLLIVIVICPTKILILKYHALKLYYFRFVQNLLSLITPNFYYQRVNYHINENSARLHGRGNSKRMLATSILMIIYD